LRDSASRGQARKGALSGVYQMEEFDLAKSFDELLKPTDPPKGAALKGHDRTAKRGDPHKQGRSAEPHFVGVDLAVLAAGRAGLAQWPQSLLPTSGRT